MSAAIIRANATPDIPETDLSAPTWMNVLETQHSAMEKRLVPTPWVHSLVAATLGGLEAEQLAQTLMSVQIRLTTAHLKQLALIRMDLSHVIVILGLLVMEPRVRT